MNCFRRYFSLPVILVLLLGLIVSACKVGDEDPFLSLRSRDARLKANWKLGNMENHYEIRVINPGVEPQVTVIHSSFNGYDMHVRTAVNGILLSDTTFGFGHRLMIKEKGKLTYENTLIQTLIGVKSTGEDNWYWLDTDKKKARVFLGAALQFPTMAGLSQVPQGVVLPVGSLFTDFTVDGLRNKELDLTYNKTMEQVTFTGFQQITVSSKMTFESN
ncbi:hypothetical protein I5M27_16880 [Adhaeribacter sp. BT258]|uniref:Uncharacterized protein n=1 Tax=Adhaeribacter terrigena TaxID=2793070 RepID=A0ABS1C5M6_9BACT|nr:hypothetical protein [Adhaeribacter terrigena]MBK0404671.1 hypothetical protein [Adhaeribacter terrigena]